MFEIHIREATTNDASLVSGLIRESFREPAKRFGLTPENCPTHPSNCTDAWVEKDFSQCVAYYIAGNNHTAVGCAALEKANPELCYLKRLGVLPEARRKGVGRALVDHVIDQANLFGAKQINIGVIADDAELKRWYRRIGFGEGETKAFEHLPFLVTFMTYSL